MEIIAFAKQFKNGTWNVWEHICSEKEIAGVLDSAQAKAADRLAFGTLSDADCLLGARYIFDVKRGPENHPKEGDLNVYGVCVDGILTGVYSELRMHLKSIQEVALLNQNLPASTSRYSGAKPASNL